MATYLVLVAEFLHTKFRTKWEPNWKTDFNFLTIFTTVTTRSSPRSPAVAMGYCNMIEEANILRVTQCICTWIYSCSLRLKITNVSWIKHYWIDSLLQQWMIYLPSKVSCHLTKLPGPHWLVHSQRKLLPTFTHVPPFSHMTEWQGGSSIKMTSMDTLPITCDIQNRQN